MRFDLKMGFGGVSYITTTPKSYDLLYTFLIALFIIQIVLQGKKYVDTIVCICRPVFPTIMDCISKRMSDDCVHACVHWSMFEVWVMVVDPFTV